MDRSGAATIGKSAMIFGMPRGSQTVNMLHRLHLSSDASFCAPRNAPSRLSTTCELPVHRVRDAWQHGNVKTSNVAVGA